MLKKIKNTACIILIAAFAVSFIYVMIARYSPTSPSLMGFSLLRVSNESLEPTLKSGDIVVLSDTPPEELKKGDIIAYNGTKGIVRNTTVTHQIVAEPYEKDGVYYFTTRGTRYAALDDPEITDAQIIGKVTLKIPIVGTLYDFFSQWYGMLSILLILLIAYSGELIALFKRMRGNKEKPDADIPSNAAIPEFKPEFNDVLLKGSGSEDFITTDIED